MKNRNAYGNEQKLVDALNEYKKICSCGCRSIIVASNKRSYAICRWCGKKVFMDEQKQIEHDKKVERENFRTNMWKMLNKLGDENECTR